ncbi:DedA family protein [Neobacillus sp. PS3-12]|jgi:membrane protein DedA with SNARE-associated domain|uniref:DedA family protein n=1 Tax=Neobacillus sp. PS3-12 TaxID=3070677 RepID=UPI0027DFE9DA|nr:DedA family protein [Neobacillus sp. PS3-12]WML51793.1 DedA family protein [Neobacillus sp. PS3-12]
MSHFIQSVFTLLSHLGYMGIALGLMVEVIPSEIVLAYGGFLISKGEIAWVGAVIAGTIGGIIAQWFLYWLGRYGGRPILDKYGKYILIQPHHIDVAQQWFSRYGAGVIFTARFIPVVRHAISIPAGIAKMSFSKFTLYTICAIIPWSILFLYLGYTLGSNYEMINQAAQPYVRPAIVVAVILTIVYLLFKWKKKK